MRSASSRSMVRSLADSMYPRGGHRTEDLTHGSAEGPGGGRARAPPAGINDLAGPKLSEGHLGGTAWTATHHHGPDTRDGLHDTGPRDAGAAPAFGHRTDGAAPRPSVRSWPATYLLTLNPIDGTEIETLPARGTVPAVHKKPAAVRVDAEARRLLRAAQPRPAGRTSRAATRRCWSVTRAGPGWCGCSPTVATVRSPAPRAPGAPALLGEVAGGARISRRTVSSVSTAHHRTPTELLHHLFAVVHDAPRTPPDRDELHDYLAEHRRRRRPGRPGVRRQRPRRVAGATPECAFLVAATPDIPRRPRTRRVEDVPLRGLGRDTASLELLEHTMGRPLTERETEWAGDLWCGREGLPLRFVQAAALLWQGDTARVAAPSPRRVDRTRLRAWRRGPDLPLPPLGEGAAPAARCSPRRLERCRPREPAARRRPRRRRPPSDPSAGARRRLRRRRGARRTVDCRAASPRRHPLPPREAASRRG